MKKRMLALLIALSMLSVPYWVQANPIYEATYIKNGTFDDDLSNWTETWQSGTGTLEVVKEKGNKVLHLESDTGRCYIRQNISNITEGDRLNVSFRMKLVSLAGENSTALITLGYTDKTGFSAQEHHNFTEINPDTWVYKGIDFIVPKDTVSMYVLMRLNYGGEVYYDDIDITGFDNKTELTVESKGLELYSLPDGLEEVTAKLHYVPEYAGESASVVFAAYEDNKIVATELKPISGDKSTNLDVTLKIPPNSKNLVVKAYIWRNGQTSDPIVASVDLPKKGRSEVYDIFAVDKMRGVYDGVELFYDTERQQKLVDLGVNTFIYNIIGKFSSGDINKSPEALDEVCTDMEKYIDETGIHIFMKASFGAQSVVSNTKFGAYHPGKTHNLLLPCPLSEEYWVTEMMSRLEVVARHPKIEGVIFDMEMYVGGQARYPASCFCDSCAERYASKYNDSINKKIAIISAKDRAQYILDNDIADQYNGWFKDQITAITAKMRERLHEINPNLIIGVMPDMERIPGISKGLGTEEMPLVVFLERTYWGEIAKLYAYQTEAEREGYPIIFAVGLWPNMDSAITIENFASEIEEAYPNDLGYWVYSGGQLENEPKYYDELKKGNDAVMNKE